ncbi:class I SAM-dependent methyltransferase [Streptomyces roseoverticillatus]|uniref:class I SAM-dependent methyltransferase n=1 Tax=Streptomyces roseoverticillatus TaxID=66429 RepID=UPI0006940FBF|nr:class I SAM-dependent methyltransferase [Streptomyces roseoverticillatus]
MREPSTTGAAGTTDAFDALGDLYEESARLPFREHLEHHSVRKAVGDVTGLDALDLGCGSGVYTRRLAAWGAARVTGVDCSASMLATARVVERARPVGARYVHADATRPVTDDGTADLVLSVYVLCYARSQQELTGVLTTARRALRPTGGRLVAVTLNPDYGRGTAYYAPYGFTLTQPEEREGAPVTLDATLPSGGRLHLTAHWWSKDTYERAARAAGFARTSWTRLTVSPQGRELLGDAYWSAYLRAPQALILEATAS